MYIYKYILYYIILYYIILYYTLLYIYVDCLSRFVVNGVVVWKIHCFKNKYLEETLVKFKQFLSQKSAYYKSFPVSKTRCFQWTCTPCSPGETNFHKFPIEMSGSNLDLLDKLGCCWYWKFTKLLFCENPGEILLKFVWTCMNCWHCHQFFGNLCASDNDQKLNTTSHLWDKSLFSEAPADCVQV